MNNESEANQRLFNARLTNVEYHQMPLTGEFLENLTSIIQLLQPRSTSTKLIRIGNHHDGGYVISSTFDSKVCLNLGVGYEFSSDLDLLSRGFKIYAIDGTVTNPLPEESEYTFLGKNISYEKGSASTTTLRGVFSEYHELSYVDLILLDIEGYEYKVLQKEMEFISKAKQIVVEFHGLELILDKNFSEQLIDVLGKISITHSPIHVHANNSGGLLPVGGANWPTILEVTFLINELCNTEFNFGPFPTKLDYPNVEIRPDVDLNPFFGQFKSYATLARTILDLN